jgi:phosphate butyryltransferase
MKTIQVSALSGRDVFARLLDVETADQLAEAKPRILVINPGSTSTKVALFHGVQKVDGFEVHIQPHLEDTADTRSIQIMGWLAERHIDPESLDAIAARGGFFRPVPSGTYAVTPDLLEDLADPEIKHAANMGVPIAMRIRELSGRDIPVSVSNPVVVDEVDISSRMTGLREFKTDGTSVHYLSHKSVIAISAWEFGMHPSEASVVSVHLGGGFSLIRNHRGRAVRVINAFSGLPAANRSGLLPQHEMLGRLEEHQMSLDEMLRATFREGGLMSLAGTNDFKTLLEFRGFGATDEQREKIDLVLDFFAQKVAEGILSSAAGWGKPDYACVTGGLSQSEEFVKMVERRLGGLLPLVRVPGSVEQEALAAGAALSLLHPECLRDYASEREKLYKQRLGENHLIDQVVFKKPVLHRKKGSPLCSLEEIIQATRTRVHEEFMPTIAIAGSDNEDALAAAMRATEEGEHKIARFILVGDREKTLRTAEKLDLDLNQQDFTLVHSDDPVAKCLEFYESGDTHVLMKGSVKTEAILGPTFRWLKENGRLPKDALYSHVAVFERKALGKLILLTDGGINIEPSKDEKRRILENALFVARSLNLPRPKAAVISAIEKVNPRIESSVEAAEIAALYRDRSDCIVEGPVSFDVATEEDIAEEKGYEGEIRGNADILVMPGIDSGNAVYKTLTTSGHDAAGCIVGGGIPVVLTSRGDSALTKLASISMSLRLYFQRMREADSR